MKKFLALMLVLCLLLTLSGCYIEEACWFYTELEEQDGFTIAINKIANCCFVGDYECVEYTDNMQITFPDEYEGRPVTRLGGYFGRGLNIPFYISYVDKTIDYSDIHNPWRNKDSFTISEDDYTEEVVFQLHIGPNIEAIKSVDMDIYYPHLKEDGSVIYYHPVVYVTCSEENPYFYAEDGRLYYKETGALVTEFAYAVVYAVPQSGTYEMAGDFDEGLTPYVWLSLEDGSVAIGAGSLASFQVQGSFEIEGNTVVAQTQLGTFVFEIKDSKTLVLIDSGDSEFFQLNEGLEFIYSDTI